MAPVNRPCRNHVQPGAESRAAFWLIKLMAVTMAKRRRTTWPSISASDSRRLLDHGGRWVIALVLQFVQKKYVPWAYWLAVVLISVVGTLVSDNLVDTA